MDVLFSNGENMVILQETKCSKVNRIITRLIWSSGHVGLTSLEAMGSVAVILIM